MNVSKNIASQTLNWLEILLDNSSTLSQDEKGQLATLINFWRLYNLFFECK